MEEEKQEKNKKKYWLKLDKNFLKSSQMRVIKSMPNGKDYIIFYLSLMLESVETVGHLRFTSLVPYNAEMLSAVTETNIDIVRSAIKIFCELGLMKIFDDGTIFIPEVPKITGKESESAERVRKFREKQKQELLQCNENVTICNDNKDKEENKNINKKEYKQEFEKLWKMYPNKKGKENAYKSFIKAIKNGTDIEIIKQGIEKYNEYIKNKKIEEQYIKHGSTWFNQKCWEDDYTIINKNVPSWFYQDFSNKEAEEIEEEPQKEPELEDYFDIFN